MTGRCTETSTIAYLVTASAALRVTDGEVRGSVQLTEGAERSRFYLWGRVQWQDQDGGGYALWWAQGRGTAELRRAQGG